MIGCRKHSAHLAYHGSRVTNTRKSHVIIVGQITYHKDYVNNSRVFPLYV